MCPLTQTIGKNFYYYIFKYLPSFFKFKNRISAVLMNQRCVIQRWFGISDVSDNADSESALYDTALIQNQRCIQQHWYQFSKVCHFSIEAMSTVSYSTNSELVLYLTKLIQN
jgi:hypothetical protein